MTSAPPTRAGMPRNSQKIYSKKFKVYVGNEIMTMFDAEEKGLIQVFHDRDLNVYSYIINATGEVVSYFLAFHESSWPEWLKDHRKKEREDAVKAKVIRRACHIHSGFPVPHWSEGEWDGVKVERFAD